MSFLSVQVLSRWWRKNGSGREPELEGRSADKISYFADNITLCTIESSFLVPSQRCYHQQPNLTSEWRTSEDLKTERGSIPFPQECTLCPKPSFIATRIGS